MRRVVITGAGAITSIGSDIDSFWENCLKGITSVDSIPRKWRQYADYTSTIRSPLPDSLIPDAHVSRIEKMQLDRVSIIAVEAACQAVGNAGYNIAVRDPKKNTFTVDGVDPEKAGVYMGTGIGGAYSFLGNNANQIVGRTKKAVQDLQENLSERGQDHPAQAASIISDALMAPRRFNPFVVSMIMPNAVSANIGIKLSFRAANETVCCACASGTVAVGKAFRAVSSGQLDLAIAGGAEYVHDEYGGIYRGFDIAKTLVQNCTEPLRANRPFDRDRTGFLFGQGGGAALILEDYERAIDRKAPIIAEIIGFEQSFDAYNIMIMEPEGKAVEKMLNRCMKAADLCADDIDYINAHGTGTQVNDTVEADVIERVFGDRPAINSTKSLIGHTIGASGAIEAVVTALSLRDGRLHPSLNIDNPVKRLNFIHQTTNIPVRHALSQSFAFGGHNAVLAFRRYE